MPYELLNMSKSFDTKTLLSDFLQELSSVVPLSVSITSIFSYLHQNTNMLLCPPLSESQPCISVKFTYGLSSRSLYQEHSDISIFLGGPFLCLGPCSIFLNNYQS